MPDNKIPEFNIDSQAFHIAAETGSTTFDLERTEEGFELIINFISGVDFLGNIDNAPLIVFLDTEGNVAEIVTNYGGLIDDNVFFALENATYAIDTENNEVSIICEDGSYLDVTADGEFHEINICNEDGQIEVIAHNDISNTNFTTTIETNDSITTTEFDSDKQVLNETESIITEDGDVVSSEVVDYSIYDEERLDTIEISHFDAKNNYTDGEEIKFEYKNYKLVGFKTSIYNENHQETDRITYDGDGNITNEEKFDVEQKEDDNPKDVGADDNSDGYDPTDTAFEYDPDDFDSKED